MPTADESRLNDLKQRWARDPGSRLYLQLADEHRKLGQLEEAESVLTKGLENRPSDLSGLVALGRVALELHKLDQALETLGGVVGRDPTHIVANKLLLEAHLQKGDAEKAGQRLDVCRLLNDRDPELEHLEYRLRQLQDAASEPVPEAEPVSEDEPSSEDVAPEASSEDVAPETEMSLDEPPVESAAAEIEEELIAEPALETPVFDLEPEPEPSSSVPSEPISEGPAPVPEVEPPVALATPPAQSSSENGDEIFRFGSGLPAPSLGSLWATPSTAEPFGNLAPLTDLAEGDVFSLPPIVVPEPAVDTEPVVDTESSIDAEAVVEVDPVAEEPSEPPVIEESAEPVESVESDTAESDSAESDSPAIEDVAVESVASETATEETLPSLDAMEELTKPIPLAADPAADESEDQGLGVSEDSTETVADNDPLLDTQRTRYTPPKFTPEETEPIPEDVRLAAVAATTEEASAAEASPEASADEIEEDIDLEAPTQKVVTAEADQELPESAEDVEEPSLLEPEVLESVEAEPAVTEPVVTEPAVTEPELAEPEFELETEPQESELAVPFPELEPVVPEVPASAVEESPDDAPEMIAEPVAEPVVAETEAVESAASETGEPELVASESEVEAEAFEAPEPAASEPAASEVDASEPASELVSSAPPADVEEVATVALGSLYLKQGHLEEAGRIFNAVLERDPGNHAALAGLNLARKPTQGESLTAMDLLADRSLAGTIPAGLTAKKLLVLTNYLGQIRAGRKQDDVR